MRAPLILAVLLVLGVLEAMTSKPRFSFNYNPPCVASGCAR